MKLLKCQQVGSASTVVKSIPWDMYMCQLFVSFHAVNAPREEPDDDGVSTAVVAGSVVAVVVVCSLLLLTLLVIIVLLCVRSSRMKPTHLEVPVDG